MRRLLTIGLLAFAGALLGSLAIRDTHATYCHTKFAGGRFEEVQEGVDYTFLLQEGGTVLLVEEVAEGDECFVAWKAVHTSATNRRLLTSGLLTSGLLGIPPIPDEVGL